ncbi:aldehyde dehydrogenase [Sporichthya sp.]|uniref:aldehyde dehydrogenase n=1 Tax=Sporichthya sp. TaxID=65475 RepID=UPI00185E62B8|nr:aldehyde dehydrogenase [Sporichthya sp.]MBA3741373.1 aldehyde dehydrogenase [Sporichthya sp.]
MRSYDTLYIGGSWTPSSDDARIEVISPHTERVIATVPDCTPADMDRAVAAARAAADRSGWPTTSVAERLALLERLAVVYEQRLPEMAEVVSAEMGSPISFSQVGQAGAALVILRAMIAVGRSFEVTEQRSGMLNPTVTIRREPVGVVGAIVPWNVPQIVTMAKLAPALVAGCTVVLKCAPESPLDAFLLFEMLDEVGFPPGVVNLVPGGREVGAHLVRHPDVDKIAFTGSTAAGRAIAAVCGETLKRCSLELGGKSAAVVLDDADMSSLPVGLKFASMINSGQACTNQTRIFASRKRYAEVVEAVVTMLNTMKVGDPSDPATEIGPMVSERQQQRVEKYIALGQEEGAKLAFGGTGRPPGLSTGWYVRPTVFADATNEMRISQEEIFGPVLSVIPYADEEEAIALANASEYGLAASVWTSDTAHGAEVAARLRSGTVGINNYSAEFLAPFGGYKCSGIGREFGREGLEEYVELKTVFPSPPELSASPFR